MPLRTVIEAPSEAVSASRPQTFRLPKGTVKDKDGNIIRPAGHDPFFGFSRSFYYEGEQRGYWRLIRIRERGNLRGVTLVPFDQIAAFIRKQTEDGK